MDFDAANNILYTGDEMGYIQRWDLTSLFDKLQDVSKKEAKGFRKPTDLIGLEEKLGMIESSSKKNLSLDGGSSTFVTGVDMGGAPVQKSKVEFSSDDINLVYRWNAHSDTINYVTYVPELDVLTSCSFDCNVYIWKWCPETEERKGEMRKVGSLVLGTDRLWKINIDK